MGSSHANLALIFDFDDTLAPDSTTLLLKHHGLDAQKFWKQDAKALVEQGYDPAHAYLKLLLDNVGPGKPLGELTNQKLRDFGKQIEPLFFPGLQQLFDDLRDFLKEFRDISIEFYIVSGGLQEIIEGCELVRKNFTAVYGCKLAGDTETGTVKYIKRCITFTEKTRFLFEINKGIRPEDTRTNALLVNKDIPEAQRRVPFKNMIYAGDGLTDIPCFSLVKRFGGSPFGVFHADSDSAKRALQEFLKTDRVIASYTPKYGPSDDLGMILRGAVQLRCGQIEIERKQAEPTL